MDQNSFLSLFSLSPQFRCRCSNGKVNCPRIDARICSAFACSSLAGNFWQMSRTDGRRDGERDGGAEEEDTTKTDPREKEEGGD